MDRHQKREQIEAIDDEVDAFHPLLQDLLERLEWTSYVEYTHGPNEMGADFVLQRMDPAIRETYYVGVIAKTDKILQNFSELERQIDECGLKRLVRNGKEEVRLQEVWVVTTKSISKNAKDKIAEKYQNRKILFFDADWLVELVDQHNPYYWHHLPNATGAYLATLSLNISQLDTQTALLQIPGASNKLIELDIVAVETDRYKKRTKKTQNNSVNFLEEVLLNKVTLLEAEMGYGKSKTARQVVSEIADPQLLSSKKVLPVFQPFSIFAERGYENIEQYLSSSIGEACYAEALASGHKFLIVLDGVDEADGESDRWRELLDRLIEDVRTSKNVQLLLTSRPFKLAEQLRSGGAIHCYAIRPVSVAKLIKFIQEVCASIDLPKRLYEELAKSELFRQLPQNPIAATLLSNLLAQSREELPSNITELYSKSVEFMLGRWDEKRALSNEKLYKACERVGRQVARYMVDNKLVYVSTQEAKEMVDTFVKERNVIGVSGDDIYEYLLKRSQLFGVFEGTSTIFFRHRSFAEYLYALDAVHQRNVQIDERAYQQYWVNVFFFYLGLLADCPNELRQLISLRPDAEAEKWTRVLQLSNYLLAGYQTPYAVVEDNLHFLLEDLAGLYLRVRGGDTKTRLIELSEMKLLWLFAMVSKHCCGYEYFHKALPLAMARLDEDRALDGDLKLYALFFAATALSDLDDKCGITFLLERHKTEALPLAISLALASEVEHASKYFTKDPIIKEHERKLKKLLATDQEERVYNRVKLQKLFERPLNARGASSPVVGKSKSGGKGNGAR